jgi:pimeloyl-[acyl-carrier protein] methyl ester esterase
MLPRSAPCVRRRCCIGTGDGMNWLLLRGLARQSEHWGDFPSLLAKAVPGDRVFTLDLPGTGSRFTEASPDSIPEIRQSVQACAGELPSPLILVGLSLGGMVAMDWAGQQSLGLAGVVAINTSSGWSPPWQRLQPGQWGSVLKILADPGADRREAAILSLTSNLSHPASLLAHWRELQHQRPVSRRTALRQMRAATRYRPPENPPSVPLLLLASQADHMVSSRCSGKLAKLWGCGFVEHPWAGHDLPLDDPEWVLEKLGEFRERQARQIR